MHDQLIRHQIITKKNANDEHSVSYVILVWTKISL